MSTALTRTRLSLTVALVATAVWLPAAAAVAAPHPAAAPPGRAAATHAPSTPVPAPSTSQPAPPQPGAPTGLRVTAVTPTSVTLAWTAPGPVAGYQISYHRAFDDVYLMQQVGDVTTVTITSSIQPTSEYTFSVAARDAEGRTSPSTSVTVVTPAGTTGDVTPPSAPTGLRTISVTPAGVALSWTASTDDTAVTGYDVYFFDGWFSSTRVGTTAGTSFTAPLMTSGTGRPAYYVRARDAAGNVSIASNTVATPTTTPTPTPPAETCRVAWRTTSQWRGGFVAEVTVTNTGSAPVDGWNLLLTAGGDQRVTSAWNATVTQQGTAVTLSAARWNATIAPGASVTAGLIGRWTQSNAAPTAATLNGAACTLA